MQQDASATSDRVAALAAFRKYFDAFMEGPNDEAAESAGLPFFDIRDGEVTELRSVAQVRGFRRGLRARMASLGFATGRLKKLDALYADSSLAVVRFESVRLNKDGEATNSADCLACLKRDGDAWRVWMVNVMRSSAK